MPPHSDKYIQNLGVCIVLTPGGQNLKLVLAQQISENVLISLYYKS